MAERSKHGYATKYVADERSRLLDDEKSKRFAKHVLQYGPERHRDCEARGYYRVNAARYDVLCSCFCIVRVDHRSIALQEAHIR
jgi:hypothetical protein